MAGGPSCQRWTRSDLLLGPLGAVDRTEGLKFVELWDDRFVCAALRGHPLARGGLSLDAFAAARHVFIAPRGRPGGAVDDALARLGRAPRRIAFTTPNFLVAPMVVARTDLIITLASRVATTFARRLPLVLFAPPVDVPGFRVAMYWHERRDADPAHRFLRDEIARAARELPAISPVATAAARRRRPAHGWRSQPAASLDGRGSRSHDSDRERR